MFRGPRTVTKKHLLQSGNPSIASCSISIAFISLKLFLERGAMVKFKSLAVAGSFPKFSAVALGTLEGTMQRKLLALAVAALAPASALAQTTCAALGTYLASQPNISQYIPPLPAAQVPVPYTQLIGTRCEANFIYSSRGGPADGYAVAQAQRIGIRVGFPLNSFDNGGLPTAWNGKVRNIGGGGLQGGLSAVTTATNAGYVGSNTDIGHPTQDNPNFPVIQATQELNYGRLDDFLRESIHQQYKRALALTEVYYGRPATRNYWDGCSTGGREGLSMALSCGQAGAPAAPNCLTPQEAQAVNRIWDGPRNDRGQRIWFPFGRGAYAGVTNSPPFGGPCGSLGIFCWSHRNTGYDFTSQPLSQFDDETELATNVVAPYSDIMSVDLDKARERGAKILMWHGGADQLIPWRQSVHYYDKAAFHYKGYENLSSWFRFFLAPGVTHCGGGAGPQPQNLFDVMVNWVETGTAPASILSTNATLGSRPMCPYPQVAIYNGGGADPKLMTSWHCGGSLKTKQTVCMDLVTKFQKEGSNALDTDGLANPATCNANSNVPVR